MKQLSLYGKPIKNVKIRHDFNFYGKYSDTYKGFYRNTDRTIHLNVKKILVNSVKYSRFYFPGVDPLQCEITKTLSHEIIHKILHRLFGLTVSIQYDNISHLFDIYPKFNNKVKQ